MARISLLVMSAVYTTIIFFVNRYYLSEELPRFGFFDSYWSWDAVVFAILLVSAVAMLVPLTISRVSSMFLVSMYVVVFIPTIAVTLSSHDKNGHYVYLACVFTISFMIPCILTLLGTADASGKSAEKLPDNAVDQEFSSFFDSIIIVLWASSAVILLARYGNLISFVGIEDTYAQRSAGAAQTTFDGYVQTYFLAVFSPYMLARGLMSSASMYRVIWLGAGFAGFIIMYGINAQKVALALPAILVAFYLVERFRLDFLRRTSFLIGLACLLAGAAYANYLAAGDGTAIDAVILHRAIGAVAITLPQYFDLFSENGYTWWTHVKGVSSIIAEPPGWTSDPRWPELGYMVGDHVYGDPLHNVNANFFVSDGVAAGGYIGMIVIGSIYGAWLVVIDRLSMRLDRTLVLLMLMPLAITQTNGPFFTTMLSFGGIFWTVLLYVWRRRLSAKAARLPVPAHAVSDGAGRTEAG